MQDFKPFWLADNMARSSFSAVFRKREDVAPAGTKKPGYASAAGLVGRVENPRIDRNETYFALAVSDSNGL